MFEPRFRLDFFYGSLLRRATIFPIRHEFFSNENQPEALVLCALCIAERPVSFEYIILLLLWHRRISNE